MYLQSLRSYYRSLQFLFGPKYKQPILVPTFYNIVIFCWGPNHERFIVIPNLSQFRLNKIRKKNMFSAPEYPWFSTNHRARSSLAGQLW